MKKLNKLNIFEKKILKNEELLTLKGGYGEMERCCNALEEGGAIHTTACFEWSMADVLLPIWCDFWSIAGYTIQCPQYA